jgi:NAD(P)-dependent dehydrogenase (short-subunit alcohol dehydrogenase family)
MKIEAKSVLVTGANRGIGEALVLALLERGAGRVYAVARDVGTLERFVGEGRVVRLGCDVTDAEQVARLAERVGELGLLINNAGTLASGHVMTAELEAMRLDMETNYFGPARVTRALLPALEAAQGGVVNVLSVVSLAAMPAIGGYSASKAAAWSLTLSMRSELEGRGVKVIAILAATYLTCGLGYLAFAFVVIDAYFLALARKKRQVGDWEFLPK